MAAAYTGFVAWPANLGVLVHHFPKLSTKQGGGTPNIRFSQRHKKHCPAFAPRVFSQTLTNRHGFLLNPTYVGFSLNAFPPNSSKSVARITMKPVKTKTGKALPQISDAEWVVMK